MSSGVNVSGSIGLANVTRTLLTRPVTGVAGPGLTAVTVGRTATMPSNSRRPGMVRKSSVPELGASGLLRVCQVTLLPLIIPPIILVFGYIRMYNSSSILPLTNTALGTNVLLTLAYVALALPYMYRAVDTGLRTIDVQTLTEAANILGANTVTILLRVIFPNIIVAVLSGAFLTLAIVIGEFTIASLLNRPAFGVYMQNVGANRAFEPAALAVISFAITWAAMGMIQLLARFAPRTAPLTD